MYLQVASSLCVGGLQGYFVLLPLVKKYNVAYVILLSVLYPLVLFILTGKVMLLCLLYMSVP